MVDAATGGGDGCGAVDIGHTAGMVVVADAQPDETGGRGDNRPALGVAADCVGVLPADHHEPKIADWGVLGGGDGQYIDVFVHRAGDCVGAVFIAVHCATITGGV